LVSLKEFPKGKNKVITIKGKGAKGETETGPCNFTKGNYAKGKNLAPEEKKEKKNWRTKRGTKM